MVKIIQGFAMYKIIASGYSSTQKDDDIFMLHITDDKKFQLVSSMRQGDSPSFLCRSEDAKILYSCSEMPDYAKVSKYKISNDDFVLINDIHIEGSGLCHLARHKGKIYGSCYESGTLFAVDENLQEIIFNIDLQIDKSKKSHVHWIEFDDSNRLFCANLGQDKLFFTKEHVPQAKIMHYADTPNNAGPRQIIADGNFLYAINECNSTVSQYEFIENELVHSKTIPATTMDTENNPGGAHYHNNTIYLCNRGANTIAAIATKPNLVFQHEFSCMGDWPRHIVVLNDSLLVVANQKSNEIILLELENHIAHLKDRFTIHGASCVILNNA